MQLPRSVRDADVDGKVVLVRADLNVPLEDGRVADDARIRASLPTLRLLLDRGAKEVRVCSHLGRPKTDEDRARYAIDPVRTRVAELLPDPRVTVLENTRFNPGETANDEVFARELASGCDLYVNDAFGSAHRAHASTERVAHLLPAYAGLVLLSELEHLGKLVGDVERPFVIVSGGAKVDDKVGVLRNLGTRADRVLIGGKMAEDVRDENPFPFDVLLPRDIVAADAFAADAETQITPYDDLPDGWLGLDIGPATCEEFAVGGAKGLRDAVSRIRGAALGGVFAFGGVVLVGAGVGGFAFGLPLVFAAFVVFPGATVDSERCVRLRVVRVVRAGVPRAAVVVCDVAVLSSRAFSSIELPHPAPRAPRTTTDTTTATCLITPGSYFLARSRWIARAAPPGPSPA